MTDSRTVRLGANWSAVISCTRGKGIVWLRLEQDGSTLMVFTCGLSPDMAAAVAASLENAKLGASGTHKGPGIKIKVSWVNRQSNLVGILTIEAASDGVGAAFKEETGQRLAAALRWGAKESSNNMPSGVDSIKAADRKRDDLMKDLFS